MVKAGRRACVQRVTLTEGARVARVAIMTEGRVSHASQLDTLVGLLIVIFHSILSFLPLPQIVLRQNVFYAFTLVDRAGSDEEGGSAFTPISWFDGQVGDVGTHVVFTSPRLHFFDAFGSVFRHVPPDPPVSRAVEAFPPDRILSLWMIHVRSPRNVDVIFATHGAFAGSSSAEETCVGRHVQRKWFQRQAPHQRRPTIFNGTGTGKLRRRVFLGEKARGTSIAVFLATGFLVPAVNTHGEL